VYTVSIMYMDFVAVNVAVCCMCAAMCYSVSQYAAVCCSMLQCVAVCCSLLQNVSFVYIDLGAVCVAMCCSASCNALQCVVCVCLEGISRVYCLNHVHRFSCSMCCSVCCSVCCNVLRCAACVGIEGISHLNHIHTLIETCELMYR